MSHALPVEPRLWPKIRKDPDGCWTWVGLLKDNGYGTISVHNRATPVHRVVYQLQVGPIPAGLELDHLCRNRACCNPAHLEPVTRRVNLSRGLKGALRTHCRNGHELTPENTTRTTRGERLCRTCKRAKDHARYQAKGRPHPTNCIRGHLLPEQTNSRGERVCRECARARDRASRALRGA